MSGTLADTYLGFAKLNAEIPLLSAQTAETQAQIPLRRAQTTQTEMAAELDRIRGVAGRKGLDVMEGGGEGDSQLGSGPPSGLQPIPGAPAQQAAYPPASVPAPAAPAAPTSDPRAPGSGGTLGAVTQPPGSVALAQAGQPGILARYPGSYQTADASGMTPPPSGTPGSVFLGATTAAPASPAAVTATPLPAPPAASTAPPALATPPQGSAVLAQAGGQQGPSPSGVSSNSVVIPGVGPVSRQMAASRYFAIMNGQDPSQVDARLALQRATRIQQLMQAADTPAKWDAAAVQAYREGLIDNQTYAQEVGQYGNRENYLRSFGTYIENKTIEANLAPHGATIGPQGNVVTSPSAQAAVEGATGARAAGEGIMREITFPNDINDPTKGTTTWTVPAPEAYRVLQQHPGAWDSSATSGGGGGPDPLAGLPRQQQLDGLIQREGGASNPEHTSYRKADGSYASTASGYYQILDSTWQENAARAGVTNPPARAWLASKEDQTKVANYLLDHQGLTPWVSSNPNRGQRVSSNLPTVPQTQGVQGGGGGMGQPGGPSATGPVAVAAAGGTPQPPPNRPPAGNTVAIGDSHVGGLRTAGIPGTFANGANPQAVLAQIRAAPRSSIEGKDVVLSGGFSNDGGHRNTGLVTQQVAELKAKGANSVTVIGVGPGAGGDAVNRELALNAGPGGYRFVPLEGQFRPGGVHLQNYGPLAGAVRTSEAEPTERSGLDRYQTASLAFTPPPSQPSQATEAQYLGPYGGANSPIVAVPKAWTPGPGVTSDMERDVAQRDRDAGEMTTRQQEALAGQNAMRTMGDIVHRLDAVGTFTGAAGDLRTVLGQFVKDFGPDWVNRVAAEMGDKFDPKNIDQVRILAKELFQQSVAQERGLTAHGGSQLTNLFGQMLPNIGMSGDAIRDMNNVLSVMQQAQLDYSQGAIEHFNRERQWSPYTRDGQGGYTKYHPLSEYDQGYNNPQGKNAPGVYVGAAGLLNKRGNWYESLNDAQQDAAIATAMKVRPGVPIPDEMMPPRYRHH